MAAAATNSPRRVLGCRDVNTIVASPFKKREEDSVKASNFLSPRIENTSRSPIGSPSKKRNAEVLDEHSERGNMGRKRMAVEDPSARMKVEIALEVTGMAGGSNDFEAEETSSQSASCASRSPDTSFNNSQSVFITGPERRAPLSAPLMSFSMTPAVLNRAISKHETRTNAETLRLRLEFAMYKVRTNQTDLPLSQLQLRYTNSPRSHPLNSRAPESVMTSRVCQQALSQLRPYRSEEKEDDPQVPDNLSSSPPPAPKVALTSLATPKLPRCRDGYLKPVDSPDKRLTSSVVRSRAADGLLSLMGER